MENVLTDLQDIYRMLQSEQEEDRLQSVRLLATSREEFPRQWIYQSLADSSWRVRKEGVELFLGRPGHDLFASEVVALLHSEENAGLRNAAMEILIRLGRKAVDDLLAEIGSEDHDVRKFVLDILGEIGDLRVVPAIISSLADRDENVRSAAAENLGKLRAADAVPHLLDAMQNDDLWFRFTILEALGQIGSRVDVDRLLQFKDETLLRKPLYDCLGRIGTPQVIEALVEGLGDKVRNVRESAVMALVRLSRCYEGEVREAVKKVAGCACVESVAELLDHHQPEMRRAALTLIGWVQDARYASPLLELLRDESLAEAALAALLAMGTAGVEQLVRQEDGDDPHRLAYTCHLIGETGYGDGLGTLLQAARSAEPELRMVAAQALAKVATQSGIDPLLELLNDEVDQVRDAARQALVRLGGRYRQPVAQALLPVLDGECPEARSNAIAILGQLMGPEVEEHILRLLKDVSPMVRRAAVTALDGHPFEGQLPALKMALTDEDPEVRIQAAEVLGRTYDARAVEALGLACQDDDIWVRAAAVRSLGLIGDEQAFALVAAAVTDPVGLVTISALETLVRMDAQKAKRLLEAALGHADGEVVKAALQELFASGDMQWLEAAQPMLLGHRHPDVRLTFVRQLCDHEGARCRQLLKERLMQEGDELVRQAIGECLSMLPEGEG